MCKIDNDTIERLILTGEVQTICKLIGLNVLENHQVEHLLGCLQQVEISGALTVIISSILEMGEEDGQIVARINQICLKPSNIATCFSIVLAMKQQGLVDIGLLKELVEGNIKDESYVNQVFQLSVLEGCYMISTLYAVGKENMILFQSQLRLYIGSFLQIASAQLLRSQEAQSVIAYILQKAHQYDTPDIIYQVYQLIFVVLRIDCSYAAFFRSYTEILEKWSAIVENGQMEGMLGSWV